MSGHIEVDPAGRRLRTTPAGRFVLNEIVLQLAADFEPAGAPEP